MFARRFFYVCAGIFLVLAPGARAQTGPTVKPGSRLRATLTFADSITRPAGFRIIQGAWVGRSEEGLVFREEVRGETLSVPLAQLARLEVSRGLRGHAGKGAAIGLAAGAAIGALLGLAAFQGQDGLFSIGSSGQ